MTKSKLCLRVSYDFTNDLDIEIRVEQDVVKKINEAILKILYEANSPGVTVRIPLPEDDKKFAEEISKKLVEGGLVANVEVSNFGEASSKHIHDHLEAEPDAVPDPLPKKKPSKSL